MSSPGALERRFLEDPALFARLGGITLRGYQVEVIRAAAESVLRGQGRSFVVMFPRQSGKNEVQAQLEAYLLYLLQHRGAELVKISPTWRPQAINALYRLERVLQRNLATRGLYWKENGYILGVGQARITFLSGAPGASIVGATATHLLEVDEAQDVGQARFDKDIAPMASSTNATRIFWGTAWTSQTLLARELRASQQGNVERAGAASDCAAPVSDRAGVQSGRAFVVTADVVAGEVPAYGDFVREQVRRLGRAHPMVRTQFFCEEIDGQAGMFSPEKVAGMVQSAGAARLTGMEEYALLIDVAGEAAGHEERPGGDRDATALTVVAVDRSGMNDPLLRAPVYRAVERRLWVGERHTCLYEEIRALAQAWHARWLVVDATGVGAGLASFLASALPGRVVPFVFSSASKSRLGWDFLEVVSAGRWREDDQSAVEGDLRGEQARLQALFFQQLAFCQSELLPGPGKVMRWGVPDGTRDPASGQPVHDDLLISAALCARIPGGGWSPAVPGLVRARDPLQDMQGF